MKTRVIEINISDVRAKIEKLSWTSFEAGVAYETSHPAKELYDGAEDQALKELFEALGIPYGTHDTDH